MRDQHEWTQKLLVLYRKRVKSKVQHGAKWKYRIPKVCSDCSRESGSQKIAEKWFVWTPKLKEIPPLLSYIFFIALQQITHVPLWISPCTVPCLGSFLRHRPVNCCRRQLKALERSFARRAEARSRPWMRAHLPEPEKAHGQVVNKWKWKIAPTCGSRSSTCKRREAVGSWWMPRVPAAVDMINQIPGRPLPPPLGLPVLPHSPP